MIYDLFQAIMNNIKDIIDDIMNDEKSHNVVNDKID